MADKPWKAEERAVARLLGGTRYPANSGGRVDVEGPQVAAQVKHVQRLSLAQLEALALEAAAVGAERGKIGLLVVKRRGGKGRDTPRLVVMTEGVWRELLGTASSPGGKGQQMEPVKPTNTTSAEADPDARGTPHACCC